MKELHLPHLFFHKSFLPHSRFKMISSSGSLRHQRFSRYLIIRCDFEQRSRDLLVVYPSYAGLFLCSYRSKASTVVSLHSFRSRITKVGTVNLIQMFGEGHLLKLRCRWLFVTSADIFKKDVIGEKGLFTHLQLSFQYMNASWAGILQFFLTNDV